MTDPIVAITDRRRAVVAKVLRERLPGWPVFGLDAFAAEILHALDDHDAAVQTFTEPTWNDDRTDIGPPPWPVSITAAQEIRIAAARMVTDAPIGTVLDLGGVRRATEFWAGYFETGQWGAQEAAANGPQGHGEPPTGSDGCGGTSGASEADSAGGRP